MDLLHTFINMYNTVKMSNVPLNVKTSKYINVFPAHSEVYGQWSTACTGERRDEKGPESCQLSGYPQSTCTGKIVLIQI